MLKPLLFTESAQLAIDTLNFATYDGEIIDYRNTYVSKTEVLNSPGDRDYGFLLTVASECGQEEQYLVDRGGCQMLVTNPETGEAELSGYIGNIETMETFFGENVTPTF